MNNQNEIIKHTNFRPLKINKIVDKFIPENLDN